MSTTMTLTEAQYCQVLLPGDYIYLSDTVSIVAHYYKDSCLRSFAAPVDFI